MAGLPLHDNPFATPVAGPALKRSATDASNEEEQNYCRICRGEGTIAQPLYYPCKCSGSIKFVHQECLMEWLSHSQKKYCELCKTSFRFTKLYDRSMPAKLPFPLFIRQLARHGLREALRWIRYILVGIIWTCCLPWSIRQVWRGFLWLADGATPSQLQSQAVAAGMSNATATAAAVEASQSLIANITVPSYLENIKVVFPPMLISLGDIARLFLGHGLFGRILGFLLAIFAPQLRRASVAEGNVSGSSDTGFKRSPSLLSDVDFISAWSGSPVVNNVTIDIVEGQLICVLLVTAFILVFLIREWVINQQPILNMPDPDAQENPPLNRDADIERLRRNLRAPLNLPQAREADPQPGNVGAPDPAVRVIAVPRRRRALTDVNILTDTGNTLTRPTLPPRSQSLLDDADHDGHEEGSEHAVGESSAIATQPGNQPMRRHSSGSRPSFEVPIEADLYETADTGRPLNVLLAELGGNAPVLLGDEGQEPAQEQQTGPLEALPTELPERRVSIVEVPSIIDEAEYHAAQDTPNDSDGPVIATPDSSSNDADDEENLGDGSAQIETAALSDVADQEAEDNSLLGKITRWLWNTEIENEAQPVAGNPHAADVQDMERVVDNVDAEAPFVPVHNRGPAQIPPLPLPNEDPPAPPREPNMFMGVDLNNAEDDAEDLDGVLELLGMEGPIFGMIQNVIFSMLLITITLMMSFWFPYMWGKIALLFLSQPTTMLIRAPIFVLSRSADIVVDIIFFVAGLVGFLLNQPMKIVKSLVSEALPSVGSMIDTATIEGYTLDLSQRSGSRLEQTLTAAVLGLKPDVPNFSMQSHHALISVKTFMSNATQSAASAAAQAHKALSTGRPIPHVLLAAVGRGLKSFPELYRNSPPVKQVFKDFLHLLYTDLTVKPAPPMENLDPSLAVWNNEDRVLAIILGYALFTVAGIVFLEIARLLLGLKDGEKVEGYFADSLRQAGGVMKVIVIIGIEMLVFPLYCGLLLDLALLPLFANATISSRIAFMVRTPLTGIFIHWFIGTCYMFHFALFVSICRKIMRKGVLYFIRDPDDPTFHPVRDVLERPVPAQLGKIAFSALIYGGLVTVCLGGVVWSLEGLGGILPIRWSTPEPRLAFPIDIVFYNFMLPFILRKAEPSKKISAMYKWWFRGCARSLRLTNFLFGEEAKDEQFTEPSNSVTALLMRNATTERTRDGSFVRAPASDSVRIPKGRNVFLTVTEKNERVDGQPDPEFGMHGREDPQFTKVYLPPNFRSRITTFIVLLWLFAACTGVAFTIGPLLVGRKITQAMAQTTKPPNDLYAFTVGVHIFAGVGYIIAYARPARDYLRSKVDSSGKQLLKFVLRAIGLAYLGAFTTVVLPFAMSLITELYVHIPIFDLLKLVSQEKVKATPSTSPSNSTDLPASTNKPAYSGGTIFILQSWTIGLLYLRILYRLITQAMDPNSRPARAIRAITRNGVWQADIALASRAFVLPATTICIVLLLFPLTYMKVIITVFGISSPTRQTSMFRAAYPLFLCMMFDYVAVVFMRKKLEKWRVKIRDEVYLIGERLHNFQEPKPKVASRKGKEKAL
jgi:E3 ubiquitin-protein ligase MARCH6